MWQTIGQDRITGFLAESLAQGTLAHAYLFVGPAHVGKMTLATDLAMALNCPSATPPCAGCRSCQRIQQGKHADIMVIDRYSGRDPKDRRKATEIGIDAVRDLMQRSSNLPPYEGKRKVFIVDNADLLSVEAANCLLKTLEEPPPHVVIILLTSDEKKLLSTVISRCQRFELKPVPLATVETKLAGGNGASQEKIRLLARLSRGCLGWAMLANRDESYLKEREARLAGFIPLLTESWETRFAYIAHVSSDRNDITEMIEAWLSWLRDVLLLKYNCRESVINIDHLHELTGWAGMLTVHEIKEFIDSLNRSLVYLASNANLHLLLEVLMIDMPKKDKRPDYSINTAGGGR